MFSGNAAGGSLWFRIGVCPISNLMRVTILCLLSLVSFSEEICGQSSNSMFSGRVIDQVTGEEVIGANVIIKNTSQGVSTDINGAFRFVLAAGSHDIQVSSIGYLTVVIESLVFSAGEELKMDIKLQEDSQQLEEIVIQAEADLANHNILLVERKKSTLAVQSIGAAELSNQGVSTVEAGLAKISGITKSDQGVFVRGLGDRYNNVYMNSLPLPSANPDKKVISLDILPTSIVRNLEVSKSYHVNRFADVSGASINIYTKDYLEQDFVSVGFGVGYNTAATFERFRTSRDGDSNYLGLSGEGRVSPRPVNASDFVLGFSSDGGDPFQTGYDVERITAPLDNSWDLGIGKTLDFEESSLDILFTSSYKNAYYKDEGRNDVLDAAQVPNTSFYRERDRFTTNLTGLLGVKYNYKDRHTVHVNYLLVNNSQDTYIQSQGRTIDFENLRRLRNRYLEKRFSAFQVNLEHQLLPDQLSVRWGGSHAKALTDEPDRKDLTFFASQGSEIGTINRNIAAENGRYFQEIDETENNLFGELTYQMGSFFKNDWLVKSELTIGYQFREKLRSVDFRTFTLTTSGVDTESIDLTALDLLFSESSFRNGDFSYRDINGGERQSRTLRKINAGYASLLLRPIEKLELIPGVRVESTDQQVFFKRLGTPLIAPFETSEIDRLDFLPSLNAKYSLDEKNQFRLGISKTLTRPNFNELVPAPQVNENLQSIVGRPGLQNSEVTNVDVSYDWFPNRGQLVSLGVFYKNIDKPIEQVRSGENFISFFNVNNAQVYGLELEFATRLSQWFNHPLLEGVTLDGNFSWLYSTVNTDPDELRDQETRDLLSNITNTSRALQGASPYVLNVSLGYDKPFFSASESSSVKLGYNLFGQRIYSVGTQQRGDEFELSYGTLDLVVKNRFESGLGISLSANNLLNPKIQREQAAGPLVDRAVITQSYRKGVRLGFSVSYLITRS